MRNILLIVVIALAGVAARNWSTDPHWIKVRYGAWGGPGVKAGPSPMDAIAVKDYAPKSSPVITETFVAKAKYPAIDAHTHVNAETPEEVWDWVRAMDDAARADAIRAKVDAANLQVATDQQNQANHALNCTMNSVR